MGRTITIGTQRTIALGAILFGLLLPLAGGLLSPAHAVQAPPPPGGASGNPAQECGGLEYLNKFDWDDDGSGAFDQGGTTGGTTDGVNYSYTSDNGVTISYAVDGGEATSATWTSVIPVDRVWEKAGGIDQSSDNLPAYDEEQGPQTETIGQFSYSHLTWCYDVDPPTVEVNGECAEVTVTITNPNEQFGVQVDIGAFSETIYGTMSYTLDPDATLVASDGGSTEYGTFTWQDCTAPSVQLLGQCDTASVIITNPAEFEFAVEVFINEVSQGFISETTDYVLQPGQTLTTSATEEQSVSWQDCSRPELPTYDATPACVDGTSTVMVTITNPDELDVLVEVLIDGVSQGTTSETTVYEGAAGQTLTVVAVPLALNVDATQLARFAQADQLQVLSLIHIPSPRDRQKSRMPSSA